MKQITTLKIISILSLCLINISLHAQQNTIRINQSLDLKTYHLIPLSKKIDTSKIIVIDFWATWCGPCIGAFPELEKIQEEFKNTIQIVSVSDESQKKIESFLDKKKYKLSFFVDSTKNLFSTFNITTLPITVMISKDKKFIWAGPSHELRTQLIAYISGEKITQDSKNPSYSKYYSTSLSEPAKSNNQFEYYINLGTDTDPYSVKNQKNKKEAVNIKYLGATVNEVLMDLLGIETRLRITNNRKDLENTIVNVVAKSSTKHITYGMAINMILNDLKDQFKFQISTELRDTEVYELKVTDSEKLQPFVNDIPGGGFAKTENGQLSITRLKLSDLAHLLEKKLKRIILESNYTIGQFDFKLNISKGIEDLNKQLKTYGLQLNTTHKEITHTIIK